MKTGGIVTLSSYITFCHKPPKISIFFSLTKRTRVSDPDRKYCTNSKTAHDMYVNDVTEKIMS